MKAFIMSQFSYCPLVWVCHSRTLKNKINKLHERALQFVYDDRSQHLKSYLTQTSQALSTTKIYKCLLHELAPELMNSIFRERGVMYNFRNNSTFETRNVKSVYYGSEAIFFFGPKIWKLLLSNIKYSDNHNIFKSNFKFWKSKNCLWCLCRLYIADI